MSNNQNNHHISDGLTDIISKVVFFEGSLPKRTIDDPHSHSTQPDNCWNFSSVKISYLSSCPLNSLDIIFAPNKPHYQPKTISGVIQKDANNEIILEDATIPKTISFNDLDAHRYYHFVIPVQGEVYSAKLTIPSHGDDNKHYNQHHYLKTCLTNNNCLVENS